MALDPGPTPSWIAKGFVVMAVVQAVLMGGGAYTLLETRQLANENGQEAEIDEARQCVNSWQSRAQIREAIAIPGEAIIEAAEASPGETTPEAIEAFRASIERRILATFPDPNCDLEAAQRKVGDR